MPTHPDAVGYLNDLANEIDEYWFKMVCDLASIDGVSVLDQSTRNILFSLYTGRASYLGSTPNTTVTATTVPTIPVDFLEQLSGFSNFKRLSATLNVTLNKRVTLIFGANGSGKSSLCESLKVLSASAQPKRPLENVHGTGGVGPAFDYKFRSDATPQSWSPAAGFGQKETTIKYFDTAIAVQNVTSAVDPGRVIALTPFKLHVFEWVTALTAEFRTALQQAQRKNAERLAEALEDLRTGFSKFEASPLATIDEKTVSCLPVQMKLGEAFADQKLLSEKRETIAELEKAATDEGMRLLRAEHRELESFLTSLDTLLTSAVELWALEPANKATTLATKQAAQKELAEALIPENRTLDELLALLKAASPMCEMGEATGHSCPLCKRELGAPEVELFKQYNSLIVGELEEQITTIKDSVDKAREFETEIKQVDCSGWDKCKTIEDEVLAVAKTGADLIISNCDITKEPLPEATAEVESLKKSAITWAAQLEAKQAAIEAAEKGTATVTAQLEKLRSELEPLEYAQAIADYLEKLKRAQAKARNAAFWDTNLPSFTQVLRKITAKTKDAHEELVVADFEAKLDAEYTALTEKSMSAFGVVLARRGADASVTVTPRIGGKDIKGVLSEGEQRVHALALFFAELDTCPQSVVVFDDPVSSFDYNYIANYSTRLRDFTMNFPDKQIIVLTHNWEFFVQLQTTLNSAGLNNYLSVQVLENCAVVADYSEKVDVLKNDVMAILGAAGEPSTVLKEEMAGKMRRLIESVVNTHVFNNQRHQYRQKSQPVSAFHDFTRIIPLLPAEATTLRDLYGKLSISEHDDLRNAYVNTDKATFQTRYDAIIAIETALIARR